jgi:hypothetical protein
MIVLYNSFGDVSTDSIKFDTYRIILGYGLMFAYTVVMLGKTNLIEQRCYLAMAGITAVGMGMMISLGLTMAVGLSYTTIHGVLPFLALGRAAKMSHALI